MRAKWLAKKLETLAVRDEDHNVITPYSFDGYELKGKVNSNQKPMGYDIFEGPNIPREHAKIEQDTDGEWKIIEDLELKAADEQIKAQISTAQLALDSINWADVTTVAKLKAIVKHLVKHYRGS